MVHVTLILHITYADHAKPHMGTAWVPTLVSGCVLCAREGPGRGLSNVIARQALELVALPACVCGINRKISKSRCCWSPSLPAAKKYSSVDDRNRAASDAATCVQTHAHIRSLACVPEPCAASTGVPLTWRRRQHGTRGRGRHLHTPRAPRGGTRPIPSSKMRPAAARASQPGSAGRGLLLTL